MRIATKTQFYRLFDAGLLGNRQPAIAPADAVPGTRYSIRVRQVGGKTLYGVEACDVAEIAAELGADVAITPAAPDDRLTMQGELMYGPQGLTLFYATDPLPMKPALRKSGRQVTGLRAVGVLRTHCRPCSYDMLMDLLEIWDDHVIEFSAYRGGVGQDLTHNVLIWEVRADY